MWGTFTKGNVSLIESFRKDRKSLHRVIYTNPQQEWRAFHYEWFREAFQQWASCCRLGTAHWWCNLMHQQSWSPFPLTGTWWMRSSLQKCLDFNETEKNTAFGVGVTSAYLTLLPSSSNSCCGKMRKGFPEFWELLLRVALLPDSKAGSSFFLIPAGEWLSSCKNQKPFSWQLK